MPSHREDRARCHEADPKAGAGCAIGGQNKLPIRPEMLESAAIYSAAESLYPGRIAPRPACSLLEHANNIIQYMSYKIVVYLPRGRLPTLPPRYYFLPKILSRYPSFFAT